MDAYPADYLVHNLPLLLLSGLDPKLDNDRNTSDRPKDVLHEGGFKIKTDLPSIGTAVAQELLKAFLDSDATNELWSNRSSAGKEQGGRFNIRSVGRSYILPPRKAPPPPRSPWLSPSKERGDAPPLLVLHSTISPLTPSSPLYPDGIFTPLWITKHQSRLPAIFAAFFSLTSDPNSSSLLDNKVKSEIINIRSVLASTNYKTKLIVILLCDDSVRPADLDERLAVIRRTASLETKSLYFLPPASSPRQVVEFVRMILVSLHPVAMEYYRDLSKHARRKRNRSTIPPPTVAPSIGAFQLLSQQGWNVRYEFKLGILAEFRQEMDAASQSYESAYEKLFSPELIESLESWKPSFNNIRLIADVLAFRIIRCQLWTGQPTGGVRSWISHRDRIRTFIERKGNGTESYSWEAWQSTWSKMMAQLIIRAGVEDLSEVKPTRFSIFANGEKNLPIVERLAPWEFLHHEGYWFHMASKHTDRRRRLAKKMPKEDRVSPIQSPASVIASKAQLYDVYLTPEPYLEYPANGNKGYDYEHDIINTLAVAVTRFAAKGQLRAAQQIYLKQALEHMSAMEWKEAVQLLSPLWKMLSWREAGWRKLVEAVGWSLYQCALKVEDIGMIVRLDWELSCGLFQQPQNYKVLPDVLEVFDAVSPRPAVVIDVENSVSSVTATFTFGSGYGNVGEPLEAQLCLKSNVRHGSALIRLSEVKIVFEGVLRPIHVVSGTDNSSVSKREITTIELHDSSSLPVESIRRPSAGAVAYLTGNANLDLTPGSIKIYRLFITPREAGDVSLASITLMVEDEKYSLTAISTHEEGRWATWWESKGSVPFPRPFGMERHAATMEILPRPPKVLIKKVNLRQVYYTNEVVVVQFQVSNEEDEPVAGKIRARLTSPREHSGQLHWNDEDREIVPVTSKESSPVLVLSERSIELPVSGSQVFEVCLSNTVDALQHALEVDVAYYLRSDPNTELSKSSTIALPIIRPFEANYEFDVRSDPTPWPSFFEAPSSNEKNKATGLKQRYMLTASLYSFASDDLMIEAMNIRTEKLVGGAACNSTPGERTTAKPANKDATDGKGLHVISPDETQDFEFGLVIQKLILGDKHSAHLDLSMEISWRRTDSDPTNVSILEVPKLLAHMSEPRVLLTASSSASGPGLSSLPGLKQVYFTIENPSMHFLTFNIGMESSEDFAFSGPKSKNMSLVPISRNTVAYRILANKVGVWVKVNATVEDAYFGKTLKVQPASRDVKTDKKGAIFVWID